MLAAMNAQRANVADLARLNFLLGGTLCRRGAARRNASSSSRADLIGCHGQTLYHQGEAKPFLGRRVAVTWQSGEGAVLAARVGVPVVSDFRPADMAAGGKGAPLVPFLDYLLYRDAKIGRIVQNIGGIANLTAIPAGASPAKVIAFDTGPGNMVIDAVTEQLFGKAYDRDGQIAASGTSVEKVRGERSARKIFSAKASENSGPRRIRKRIRARLLKALRTSREGRCRGYRDGADREIDCGCHPPLRYEGQGIVRRVGCVRGRSQQSDFARDARQ